MAANTQSQHRCVFVGNIPYDATEEQLVQICEEVGPVVSFRLVIDRETGKPKGYGFCEYKDEETALSARRNLQGYEINGRQLRVDFAENDKNADRNRELGHGGPGVSTNVDAQKQFGGPAGLGLPNLHQPIGDSVAMAAATVMAGALGSAQVSSTSNQIGLKNQSLFGADPLTCHLARMSRSQLTEVVSELKAMATQNKEQARQLLLAIPNLRKALFQAQIMLGIVSPQMLQTSNIHQASSAQSMEPLVQNAQILPGLPPLPHNNTQSGLFPCVQKSRVSSGILNHYATVQNLPTQAQIQLPQLTQGQLLSQLVVPSRPSIHPQSVGQQIQATTSSSFIQQMQHPFSQNVAPAPPTTSGHIMAQNSSGHASMLVHPKFSAAGFQFGSSSPSGMPERMDLKGAHPLDRASKKVKLNNERANPSPQAVNIAAMAMSAPFPTRGVPGKQISGNEAALSSEKQATQVQLPLGVDATLLQQVLSLTPEQLSCLPPDQQQQVIRLQQTLRQAL